MDREAWTRFSVLCAVGGAVLWGASLPAFKAASVLVPPIHIALIQFTAGALALNLYLLLRQQHGGGAILRQHWRIIVLWSIFGTVIPMLLQNFSILHTTATATGVLQQLDPVFTLGLAVVLLHEKVRKRAVVGGAVALVGAILLSSGGRWDPGSATLWGNLGMIGVGLSYAISHIIARQALDRGIPPLVLVAHGLIAAVIVFIGLVWLEDPVQTIPSLPVTGWLIVASIGIFSTALGTILYFTALRTVPVHRVAFILFLIPIVSALLGGLVLGERLTWWTLATSVVILAGVAVTIDPREGGSQENE